MMHVVLINPCITCELTIIDANIKLHIWQKIKFPFWNIVYIYNVMWEWLLYLVHPICLIDIIQVEEKTQMETFMMVSKFNLISIPFHSWKGERYFIILI